MIDPNVLTIISFASVAFGLYMALKNNKKSDLKEAQANAVRLTNIENSIATIETMVRDIKNEQLLQRAKDEEIHAELRDLNHRVAVNENRISDHGRDIERILARLDKE